MQSEPTPEFDTLSFEALAAEAERYRRQGCEVVVVQGLGFVGGAVAAVVAGARDGFGQARYFVIGVELPTPTGRRKVESLNSGQPSVGADDPELRRLVYNATCEVRNLRCVVDERAYSLADIVVIDLPLDVDNVGVDRPEDIEVGMDVFVQSVRVIGQQMRPDALVVLESTVPMGTCERVVVPALREEREKRGINSPVRFAYCFERVMPGANYTASIRRNWRAFAGVDEKSSIKARDFLSAITDVETYPLKSLSDVTSTEFAKLLENSYRAANIAFIYEWTLLAEQVGVDLYEVIDAIRVRKGTHDNVRLPGFGVGGYCLTKDSYLAQWAATRFWSVDVTLFMTLHAMRINRFMPLHTLDLMLELSGGTLEGKKVAVMGVSYLPDVADTRNSPTEVLIDELIQRKAIIVAHDVCVTRWPERPDVRVTNDLDECLRGADTLVLTTAHQMYSTLTPEAIVGFVGKGAAIVDAQNVISDDKAEALRRLGCRLIGVGKGHWRKRGYGQLRGQCEQRETA